jgi:hydrogenase nickel incorporation protein HypA/HybF
MHEMGIAMEIHRCCREAAREHGLGRIAKVRLKVGDLAAVEPDLIKFAWRAVIHDGPDMGAELEIVWIPATQFCSECNELKNRSEGSWLRLCPDCGLPLIVEGGDELDILDFEYITDDENL